MHVRLATTPADAALADTLVNEYAEWLMELADLSVEDLPPSLRDELDGPFEHYVTRGGAILLAATGGLVALRPDDDGTAELKRMFVRASARGTGAGCALLDAAIATARAPGYRRLRPPTAPRPPPGPPPT